MRRWYNVPIILHAVERAPPNGQEMVQYSPKGASHLWRPPPAWINSPPKFGHLPWMIVQCAVFMFLYIAVTEDGQNVATSQRQFPFPSFNGNFMNCPPVIILRKLFPSGTVRRYNCSVSAGGMEIQHTQRWPLRLGKKTKQNTSPAMTGCAVVCNSFFKYYTCTNLNCNGNTDSSHKVLFCLATVPGTQISYCFQFVHVVPNLATERITPPIGLKPKSARPTAHTRAVYTAVVY